MKLQKYKTSRLQADFIQGHHRTSEGFYKPERRVSSHGLRSYIVCTSIIVLSNQPTTLLLYTYTYTYTTYYTTTIYIYIYIMIVSYSAQCSVTRHLAELYNSDDKARIFLNSGNFGPNWFQNTSHYKRF